MPPSFPSSLASSSTHSHIHISRAKKTWRKKANKTRCDPFYWMFMFIPYDSFSFFFRLSPFIFVFVLFGSVQFFSFVVVYPLKWNQFYRISIFRCLDERVLNDASTRIYFLNYVHHRIQQLIKMNSSQCAWPKSFFIAAIRIFLYVSCFPIFSFSLALFLSLSSFRSFCLCLRFACLFHFMSISLVCSFAHSFFP